MVGGDNMAALRVSESIETSSSSNSIISCPFSTVTLFVIPVIGFVRGIVVVVTCTALLLKLLLPKLEKSYYGGGFCTTF